MSSANAELAARDLAVVWHPCTQMKDHEGLPPIPVRRAEGVWLEDFDGNRYIDGISSWWVNLFGHGQPHIAQRIARQARELEHVLLAGFTHGPAVELAERLVKLAPAGLGKCFYADNGSSAIEVALKMSFHYWRNCGRPQKTRFINLTNSYHGETLGALAVGDVALYKQTYAELLLEPITVPGPDCYLRPAGATWQEHSEAMLVPMRQSLERHAEQVCAVIVEPLVQAAGSMRMYHPAYLSGLRALCDEFGVHLIADEIAVGFGRTGTLFACEQAAITPDFLCLSKGLTGGFLPLSVVLTRNSVYDAFYDDYGNLTAFLHSHSYTGNALGCAAALATLELFAQRDVLGDNRVLARRMASATAHLEDHPNVAEVRQHGMILAIELVKDRTTREPFPWQERRGRRVHQHGLRHGVLLRPLGDVVYFMPPYVITGQEIDLMVAVATEGIEQAVA